MVDRSQSPWWSDGFPTGQRGDHFDWKIPCNSKSAICILVYISRDPGSCFQNYSCLMLYSRFRTKGKELMRFDAFWLCSFFHLTSPPYGATPGRSETSGVDLPKCNGIPRRPAGSKLRLKGIQMLQDLKNHWYLAMKNHSLASQTWIIYWCQMIQAFDSDKKGVGRWVLSRPSVFPKPCAFFLFKTRWWSDYRKKHAWQLGLSSLVEMKLCSQASTIMRFELLQSRSL